MEVVVPVSPTVLPCVTVPAGFGLNGLPIGIQLAARRGDDAKLLRLAQTYREAVDWPSNSQLSSTIYYCGDFGKSPIQHPA
jgi:Asp-tRNA(Asn)/Glu-tRNA(Gln) amidotransferase A subunit family amidase